LAALADHPEASEPLITKEWIADAAASPDGRFLYVQTGAAGGVDAFRVGPDGALTPAGSVTVPGAAGGEGIAVS